MRKCARFALILLGSLVLASCQSKENIDNYDDKFSILINRYLSYDKIRYSENAGWARVGGTYRLGLDPDDNLSPREGTFIIEMVNYTDPLCPIGQTCNCTGLLSGKYSAEDYKPSKEPADNQAPYDPLKPYNSADPDSGANVTTVYGFTLSLKIERRALNQSCPEFLDYSVVINVYPNHRAILGEANREYYVTIPTIK